MIKGFTNFLDDVTFFFSSLDILKNVKNSKPKFIFFSENKSYQKYSIPLIDSICKRFSDQIYYFSIDKSDKINSERVSSYYINPFLISYFFNNIKSKNMFLTLTDLGNNFIKKTKNIDNYIYYFHSPVSTTKNYTPKAFDNYDIIMCNGQFQIDEIKSRENLKKLPKKILIPSGYFYFDYLIENIDSNTISNEILVAPSWNKNLKNFINENFIELIDILIKKKYKVTFRPHPEHFKRSKKILNIIKKKFLNQSFKLDVSENNLKSMEKAKCLITDSSGISIEYMISKKKPVLYFDEVDKIHNSEFGDYSDLKTIDQVIKDNFGYLFKKKDFSQIDIVIKSAEQNFDKNLPKLNNLMKDSFFNFGNTKRYLESNIEKFL